MRPSSQRHRLLFLRVHRLFDFRDVLVGELLDLGDGPLLVVLAHFVALEQLLQVVVDVAPHVADGHAAFLGVLVGGLDQELPTLLRELRNRDADELAVVDRRQAEV